MWSCLQERMMGHNTCCMCCSVVKFPFGAWWWKTKCHKCEIQVRFYFILFPGKICIDILKSTFWSTFLVVGKGWLPGEKWDVQPWMHSPSLGSISTLTKPIIIIFQKMNSFLQIQNYYYFMIYHDIVIWWVKLYRFKLEIIMTIFNNSTSYFHKKSLHYFKDYFLKKLALW
jgi:hypothetical protein